MPNQRPVVLTDLRPNSKKPAHRADERPWGTASVCHELRTPLNAVIGFTQLLRTQADVGAAHRARYLRHIERAARHLLALVEDLAAQPAFQSGAALRIAAVPVDQVVDDAVGMVGPIALKARVPVVVEESAERVAVMADRLRLRQVLINLLTNAIKYSRHGRPVRVAWSHHEAGHVRLSVCDAGRGLRPAQVHHLFEPFNRLGAERSRIEGTGIGLAIAREWVRLMQGDIEVSSQFRCGSTFAVILPAAV